MRHLRDDVDDVRALVHATTGEEPEDDGADREDIAATVDRLRATLGLSGAMYDGVPRAMPARVTTLRREARESEVEDLHPREAEGTVALLQHQVLGLEIAMDHALRVGSGEDVEDVVGDREDLVGGERSAGSGPRGCDPRGAP